MTLKKRKDNEKRSPIYASIRSKPQRPTVKTLRPQEKQLLKGPKESKRTVTGDRHPSEQKKQNKKITASCV
jgi:hypothetical protein